MFLPWTRRVSAATTVGRARLGAQGSRLMHFALTDEEVMIRDAARRIAADRLAPLAARLDAGEGRAAFLDNLKALAANGFTALNVAADHGGTEAGTVAFALAVEELAHACAATAVTVSVTNMVGEIVQAVGSEAQKRTHLPMLADGTYPTGAFCLTEAAAGSDPSAMTTRARRARDGWLIEGEKIYITGAEYAGLFVVWAVTDPDAPKGKGISCFLVERDASGLVIGKAEKKMGQTGSAANAVRFDGCRVPGDALLGRENDGFRIAVGELAGGASASPRSRSGSPAPPWTRPRPTSRSAGSSGRPSPTFRACSG